MNKRIQKAIYYIESHLDDELDITLLANISSYSPFHFCRVFKLQMGESVMSYTTRLRLETASINVGFGNSSVTNIALDSGFQTSSGFLKAFKKHFGVTPTAYKRRSKQAIKQYQEINMEASEIISREKAFVVFSRERGGYFQSSDIAWERLSNALNSLGAKYKDVPACTEIELDIKKAEMIGICHDDPKVTDEDKVRYDACIAWRAPEIEFLNAEGFETKTIAAGKYVKTLHKGSYESSENSWYGLYAWIEQKGLTLRDEPSFEKYLNTPEEVKEAALLTEIYVPIT